MAVTPAVEGQLAPCRGQPMSSPKHHANRPAAPTATATVSFARLDRASRG